MKKKMRLLIGAALLLIGIGISAIALLKHKGFLLPEYVTWQERELSSDGFDIILSKKHLKVYKNSNLVWESDSSVKVQDVILTDVDRNGMTEILKEIIILIILQMILLLLESKTKETILNS